MDAVTLLNRAGWFPGRRVDRAAATSGLLEAGYDASPAAVDILREYSGLTVASPDATRDLWIDGQRAAVVADPEWCRAYAEHAQTSLIPVGGYSHMTLLVDPHGSFWGGYDSVFGRVAGSVEELIRVLLIDDPAAVPLDRRVE